MRPERATEVISPAYDAFTPAQRMEHRERFPLSYLWVTRSASDEHDGDTVTNETLVQRGRESLLRLLDADAFVPLAEPAYLVYELETADHRQRGVVAEVSAQNFADSARPHEGTRPERAALLAAHFAHVAAASSPVTCTIADGDRLAAVLADLSSAELILDHAGDDGLHQRVWRVTNPTLVAAIAAALEGSDLFIVDGHHRAAANRYLLDHGQPVPVLVAVFPPESLGLAGFHRLVALGDLGPTDFIQRVGRRFQLERLGGPVEPQPGSVVMGVDGEWFRVIFDERPIAGSALVHLGALDPSVVEREIIGAIVDRPGGAADVTYLPGDVALDFVAAHARAEDRIPILVAPIEVSDMVTVASGGAVMPPKSTYFVPKVRSGVFLRLLD